MTANPELSLTQSYRNRFVISRSKNDGVDLPCVVRWSPNSSAFTSSGLVLLHHNAAGDLDPVPIEYTGIRYLGQEVDDVVVVTGWGHFVQQLEPGAEVSYVANLPECYYKAMRAGETYTLLYPGEEILMWEWGTLTELTGREIKKRAPAATTDDCPNPLISGGARITFKAVDEDEPWPDRAARLAKVGFDMANFEETQWREALRWKRAGSPPPMEETERVPGAPVITTTLSCPPHFSGDEDFSVQVTFTYEGVVGPSGATEPSPRPITIHAWTLHGVYCGRREGLRVDRWVKTEKDQRGDGNDVSWEKCEDDDEMGYLLVDEDVAIRVGQDNKNFISLMPGEAWTTSDRIHNARWRSGYIPENVAPGDTFRCRHKGIVMDWWDWGTMADHVDTVVKLPSFIAGKVTEPADNGGRPKLIVTAAEEVRFTYTGAGRGAK
ncbi:hypothetical protein DL546_006864 [Coniochaeta pulveracea]|nr:hypothetical protein DL546_006864 [Coniochaeta pulveracea]